MKSEEYGACQQVTTDDRDRAWHGAWHAVMFNIVSISIMEHTHPITYGVYVGFLDLH